MSGSTHPLPDCSLTAVYILQYKYIYNTNTYTKYRLRQYMTVHTIYRYTKKNITNTYKYMTVGGMICTYILNLSMSTQQYSVIYIWYYS